MRTRSWPGAGLVVLVACTEPNPYLAAQLEDAGTEPSSGTTGADSTGGPGPGSGSTTEAGSGEPRGCEQAGMQCIEAAPDGWEGPFAWREALLELSGVVCLAPWDRPLTEAFTDIMAPAAECDCECGPLVGASCGGATMSYYLGSGCMGPSLSPFALEPGCNDATSPWPIEGSFAYSPPTVVDGACMAQPTEIIEEPRFLSRHLACGATLSAVDCGAGRLCAERPEDPYAPRWCVWHEGDLACPEGSAYLEPRRLYRGIDDHRDCQTCECPVPPGPRPGNSLQLANSADCMGTSAGSVPAGGCSEGLGSLDVAAVSHAPGTLPADECTPSVVTPIGTAVGSEPVTFCCSG